MRRATALISIPAATLIAACVCEHLPGRTAVHDNNFQQHLWNGTATPESEYLNWETEAP
ncbi:hypothetical protein [Nocardia sp. NPDC058705]|uniref:hypothetical protein n=1 Tax=Nocardia sp. NPDC058705 TaxID=3346609 RepID=UPI0036C5F9B4